MLSRSKIFTLSLADQTTFTSCDPRYHGAGEGREVLCYSCVSGTTSLQILSHFYLSASDTFVNQSTFLSPSLSYCHVKSRLSFVDFGN